MRQTLASGIHLLVAPRPHARLVALEIRVRSAGSANETPSENGLAHAVEHMVFKGNDARVPGAFDAAFERMGGEVVAQTDRAATVYRVCVLPEHFEAAALLLAELLTKPAFRDADWQSEQAVILREMRVAQSDPAKLGLQTAAQTAFPGDAHGQPIMGSPANVTRFTAADLRTFHAAHYMPANLTIAIAGAVTADAATLVIGKAFRRVSVAPLPPQAGVGGQPTPGAPVTRAPLYPAAEQTTRDLATVFVAFRAAPLAANPKHAAAADVLAAFLARGANGLLPARIRADTQQSPVSVEADYVPTPGGATFVVQVTGSPASIGRTEDAVVALLDELALQIATGDTAPLAGEFAAAKESVIGEAQYRRETVDGEARYLAFLDTLNAPDNYADNYAEQVRAVTFADVLRVLEREVAPAKRVSAVIGLAAGVPKSQPTGTAATP